MQSLVEYLNESLIMELNSETYLNAAKKAKLKGDPRVEKFMKAFHDAVEKELNDTLEGDPKINEYYRKDKKIFNDLKKLASKSGDYCETSSSRGEIYINYQIPYKLNIKSKTSDARVSATLDCDTNNGIDTIFFRKSIVPEKSFKNIMDAMSDYGMKESDFDNDNPFIYIKVFTNGATIRFFYFVDTDHIVGEVMRSAEGTFKGNDILDNLQDIDKNAINTLLSTINTKHKDI